VWFADAVEDDAVARVGRHGRTAADGEVESPLYLALFASGAPSAVTKGVATDEQATLVTHLMKTIGTNPLAAPLRPLLPSLEAARAGVESAQADRRDADAAEVTAWNALQIAESAARDAYNGTHPRLMILFPGSRRLVESFFVKAKRKKGGSGNGDASGEGPA
jgi:hypothetical protein